MDNLDGNCKLEADIFAIVWAILHYLKFLIKDLSFFKVYSSSKQPDLLPRSAISLESTRNDEEGVENRYFTCEVLTSQDLALTRCLVWDSFRKTAAFICSNFQHVFVVLIYMFFLQWRPTSLHFNDRSGRSPAVSQQEPIRFWTGRLLGMKYFLQTIKQFRTPGVWLLESWFEENKSLWEESVDPTAYCISRSLQQISGDMSSDFIYQNLSGMEDEILKRLKCFNVLKLMITRFSFMEPSG